MTKGKITCATVVAMLALGAAAPAGHADDVVLDVQGVCNQATPHSLGGSLETLPGDPTPPARYTKQLKLHPGKGKGLVNAAGNSPALQLCGVAPSTDGGGDNGGGEDGGGSGGGGVIS